MITTTTQTTVNEQTGEFVRGMITVENDRGEWEIYQTSDFGKFVSALESMDNPEIEDTFKKAYPDTDVPTPSDLDDDDIIELEDEI